MFAQGRADDGTHHHENLSELLQKNSFLMLFSNSIRMEQCCDFIFTPHTMLSCEKSHTIKTQWVRFRYPFMIITDIAIEILDVTPMESKDSDKRKTYVSFFSEDCSVLNVEIMSCCGEDTVTYLLCCHGN